MIFTKLFQPIAIVNSPRLRAIFLMLRKELGESDIPGRTTIRTHIQEVFEDHLNELQRNMNVRHFFFFLTDIIDLDTRHLWGKSPSQPTCGLIRISLRTWPSQPIGSRHRQKTR